MNQAEYANVHRGLRNCRGSARERECAHCLEPALDWAYDHQDPDERVVGGRGLLRNVRYSLDLGRYIPLCRPCHRRFDHPKLVIPTPDY